VIYRAGQIEFALPVEKAMFKYHQPLGIRFIVVLAFVATSVPPCPDSSGSP